MKVVILCGGEGTRLKETAEWLPKPMVAIGEKPIVWHIMKYYASFGFKEFVLCLGYKAEVFVDYFLNYRARHSDVTVSLAKTGDIQFHSLHEECDWKVTLAHTGLQAMTGCRLYRAAKYLTEENFLLTYGDGVSTIDLSKLISFHLEHGRLATVSAVHPSGRFGEMDLEGHRVAHFNEKLQTTEGYINGGFMVLKRKFIDRYLKEDPDLALEREPFSRAAQDGNIFAYQHGGFWQCMDTPREYKLLNQLWAESQAPWKRW